MFNLFKRKTYTEEEDAKTVDEALKIMEAGDGKRALSMLVEVAKRAPKDYRFEEVTEEGTRRRYWALSDFMHGTSVWSGPGSLVWIVNAYGRACFYSGFILYEQKRYAEALKWLDRGLELEPNSPNLLFEKANVLRDTGHPKEAAELFLSIAAMEKACPPPIQAASLRALGFIMTEYGDLDRAEQCYRASLEIAPDNPLALNELEYISHLRLGKTPISPGVVRTKPTSPGYEIEDVQP